MQAAKLTKHISYHQARDVLGNACHYMVEALKQATAHYGKDVGELAYISSHQANQRIVRNISRQTGIPEKRFLSNIERRGNTGSPGCAIALSENLDKIKDGDLVGLPVFGGGYSCGAVLCSFEIGNFESRCDFRLKKSAFIRAFRTKADFAPPSFSLCGKF